jgi:hypothetical protein
MPIVEEVRCLEPVLKTKELDYFDPRPLGARYRFIETIV